MNKVIKNTFTVAFSQIVVLLAGILTGLFLPKLMSMHDYGVYKLYTMYLSYVGLFHFGFLDGIYLKYGGVSFDNLNKSQFRQYSRYIIVIETVFAEIISIVSILVFSGEYAFVFCALAICVITANLTTYYQYISQVTQRFKEYSFRNILRSILTVIVLLSYLFLIRTKRISALSYQAYIFWITLINIGLLLWYLNTYRLLTFGRIQNERVFPKDIFSLHKIGLPLMLANLLVSLIFALDRQFVSLLFSTETFAMYSFAYNLLSLASTVVASISVVIYPMLKENSVDRIIKNYFNNVAFINIFIFACLVLYFPFIVFLKWFLPNYYESTEVFRAVLPGLALSSTINIIIFNHYKALNKSLLYFKKCVIILMISIIANMIAYIVFKTPISISYASIISLFIWYLIVNNPFKKEYQIKTARNTVYIVTMIILFYIATYVNLGLISAIIYFGGYLVFTGLFFKTQLLIFLKKN